MPDRQLLSSGIIRNWIFDLDGTLTRPVHDFAMIKRELDIPEHADILDFLEGLTGTDRQKRYDRLHAIEEELASCAVMAPGAACLVEKLLQQGCNLGMVTRNSRSIAIRTLEAIGLSAPFMPETIIGRYEAEPKPHPAGIYYLQKLWQAPLSSMVMVGDYIHDLAAGRAASILTIHVERPDKQRWPHDTDIMVQNLQELTELLNSPAPSPGLAPQQ